MNASVGLGLMIPSTVIKIHHESTRTIVPTIRNGFYKVEVVAIKQRLMFQQGIWPQHVWIRFPQPALGATKMEKLLRLVKNIGP